MTTFDEANLTLAIVESVRLNGVIYYIKIEQNLLPLKPLPSVFFS
jgi:hypothetical protein